MCGNSWLKKYSHEWTISHSTSGAAAMFLIGTQADIGSYFGNNTYDVRPTLYLDSSVYILKGDGSEANPYVIGM